MHHLRHNLLLYLGCAFVFINLCFNCFTNTRRMRPVAFYDREARWKTYDLCPAGRDTGHHYGDHGNGNHTGNKHFRHNVALDYLTLFVVLGYSAGTSVGTINVPEKPNGAVTLRAQQRYQLLGKILRTRMDTRPQQGRPMR